MRFLIGHTKEVRDVAYLPDGRLVSISGDKTARVWDPLAGTGTVIHKAKGPLYALAVSPDGRTVAVSGRHPTPGTPVTLYDVESGQVSRTLKWTIEDTVWRGNGIQPFAQVREPVVRSIWSLSFSPDGKWIIAAARKLANGGHLDGGGACFWGIRPKRGAQPWLPHPDSFTVRYSLTGSVAFAVERRIWLYDPSAGTDPVAYPLQCDWAPAVVFLPADGRAAIAAGSYVHLVDPTGNRKPVKVKSESRTVTALAPTPDGKSLLVGGKPGRVEVFDLSNAKPIRLTTFDFDVGGVHGLAVAPDGLTFAVAADKGLLICDVEAG
jgi:WD40 repeat protein